jgi:hypothetical protein
MQLTIDDVPCEILIMASIVGVCIVPFVTGVMMLAGDDSRGVLWTSVSGGIMAFGCLTCVLRCILINWLESQNRR